MGIAAIALIIGFGILLAREYEEGVLLTLFCAAMNYIAIPLIILFLENIIPLLILIVVGIIIIKKRCEHIIRTYKREEQSLIC